MNPRLHRLHFEVNFILKSHLEFVMAQQDDFIRTALRVPPTLHKAIHEAAAAANRTFNAEIISRLQQSFEDPEAASGAVPMTVVDAAIKRAADAAAREARMEIEESLRAFGLTLGNAAPPAETPTKAAGSESGKSKKR